MKTYKRGQKLISLTNDQGLECGKIYTFMGEEFFNLPLMEKSSHETKFLKVLDSSGKTHIITEKHGLFHDSRDTWSPEARAAALESRRRKARMRAKTPKEIESAPVKKESFSDVQGIYDLNEDRIKSLQKYSNTFDESTYKFPLKEEDFLPGGKYEQAAMELLNLENRESFKEYLKKYPDEVKRVMGDEYLRVVVNKIDVENSLFDKLKDKPLFLKLTESKCRSEIKSIIYEWSQTSGDSNVHMIATQMVANKIFSINGQLDHFASKVEEGFQNVKRFANSEFGEMRAKFLQAQYESTQRYLKENGVKELVLYRGYKGDKEKGYILDSGHSVDVELQPLSSFSTSLPTAVRFAETYLYPQVPSLIAVTVKADRILSTPKTGFGCFDEKEVVILGGKIKATVYSGVDKLKEIGKNCSNVSELLDKVSVKEDN